MKIFCVGWNYISHTKELVHEVPSLPLIFLKPDSAIKRKEDPFFLPDFSNNIQYEAELIFRISRLGKSIDEKFAHRYYDALSVGIDFTARDLQSQFRAQGEPWEISKGFDQSAVIGDWVPIDAIADISTISFSLNLNGQTAQQADSSSMIFSIDKIIAYISRFYTLKIGDVVFTGTPSGVGSVQIGDRLEGLLGHLKVFDFEVK